MRNGAERIYAKARKVYRKLKNRLIIRCRGWYLAVEPESGDYVTGRDALHVVREARRRHPDRLFGLFRIGHRGVHKFRAGGA